MLADNVANAPLSPPGLVHEPQAPLVLERGLVSVATGLSASSYPTPLTVAVDAISTLPPLPISNSIHAMFTRQVQQRGIGAATAQPPLEYCVASRKRLRTKVFVPVDAATVEAKFLCSSTSSCPLADPTWSLFIASASAECTSLAVEIRDSVKCFVDNVGAANLQSWWYRIGSAFPTLSALAVDEQLVALATETWSRRFHHRGGNFGSVEFFAGSGNITRHQLMMGVHAVQFDSSISNRHDCLTHHGLRSWLNSVMDSAEGALTWFGTQCSSFVNACSHQHKRSASNAFLGDTRLRFVVIGSVVCAGAI